MSRAAAASAWPRLAGPGGFRRDGARCWRDAGSKTPAPVVAGTKLALHDGLKLNGQFGRAGTRTNPTHPDWAGGLRETSHPEQRSALARLANLLAEASRICQRSRPARLQCHFSVIPTSAFSRISRRQIWHATRAADAERPRLSGDLQRGRLKGSRSDAVGVTHLEPAQRTEQPVAP